MYDLTKLVSALRHLQKISPNMYKDIGGELMLHCPYCDDATRPNAFNHGHLYLAKNAPVFNCFRCDTSGTMVRLLIDTDFQDDETLKYIASFIKYNFISNYSKKSFMSYLDMSNLYNENIRRVLLFKKDNPKLFDTFKTYMINRIGNIDYNLFFIYPYMLKIKDNHFFTCSFNNGDNRYITSRSMSDSAFFRYKNSKDDTLYYFQPRNFNKFRRIVLGEGPFDIINLYLYSNLFKDCLFMSISGKKFASNIETLITNFLLIGSYEINIIFDNDYKNKNLVLFKCRKLAERYNPNISIKGYTPLNNFNDTGDFPQVMEIHYESNF